MGIESNLKNIHKNSANRLFNVNLAKELLLFNTDHKFNIRMK